MESFLLFFQAFLDILDKHEGSVAMLGIAITVLIFRKEVTNNYFTLERDNFNEIFKDIILKDIPNKLTELEAAKGDEWEAKFQNLEVVLDDALVKAKYFKYAMPYFYAYLKEIREKIGDLERHDNWMVYRTSARQTFLVEKYCRKMINAIINASKGKILIIRLSQRRLIKTIRHYFERKLVDRPTDRILESRIKSLANDFITVTDIEGNEIHTEELKNISCNELLLKCKKSNMVIRNVIAFAPTSKYYFGYRFNLRFGKHIGYIDVISERDENINCIGCKQIKISDSSIHKVLLLWSDVSNMKVQMYDVIKIKKSI